MSLKTLGRSVRNGALKQVAVANRHSPTALFGLGVIGFGTSLFLACRATLKVNDVLDAHEPEFELADKVADEETAKKARFGVQLRTAIDVAKLYAPAIIVGAASIAAFTTSHMTLQKRYAGAVAAFTVVNQSLHDYRGRVVAELGEEKDMEFLYGTVDVEEIEDGPDGPIVKTVKKIDTGSVPKKGSSSRYAQWFDPENENWRDVPHQNTSYIQGLQQHYNNRLSWGEVVFLNDVYKALGMKQTAAGQRVGWAPNSKTGDNFVDFRIIGSKKHKDDFAMGRVVEVLIDFNVQGIVDDLLGDIGEDD